MESLSGQSFIPSNLGHVDDEEMIPAARGLSQSEYVTSSPLSAPCEVDNGGNVESNEAWRIEWEKHREVSGITPGQPPSVDGEGGSRTTPRWRSKSNSTLTISGTERDSEINDCFESSVSESENRDEESVLEGKESIEDDGSSGHSQSSPPAENNEKVSAAIRKKRFDTISKIAESVGISEATCQQILAKDLNMHRVCQHIVPRILSEDQKAIRMELMRNLISAVDIDPSLTGRNFTGDEK
ncbi:uncharacterized protein TNCV_3957911 [Trichonephila clavipes]|nr:uncharacterized protein TNCV_3957911 [Trichonephila clavipes]